MNFKLITISITLLFCVIAKSQNNTSLSKLHEQTDKEFVNLRAKKNPLIGVSATRGSKGGSVISGTYIQAILKAGGTPIVIPVMTNGVVLRDIIKQLDGLVITGGDDIAPSYYNEKRIPKLNE